MFHQIRMGIAAPNADEAKDAQTLDGMRRAIFKASRDSAIIHNCFIAADYQGLDGEDKYTLLAYRALLVVEQLYKAQLHYLNTNLFTGRGNDFTGRPIESKGL